MINIGFVGETVKAGLDIVKDNVGTVIKKVVGDPVKEKALENEFAKILAEAEEVLEDTIKQEIQAKEKIIVQELSQGDNFTKRLRPTIGYFGLAIMFIAHVIAPIIATITGVPIKIELPGAFWVSWTSIIGLYSIGRSFEKNGGSNILSALITGSKKILR